MGYIGGITHLLTFDPNFQRDIQVRGPPLTMPRGTPQEIAGLMIRDYENPLVSLNKAGY